MSYKLKIALMIVLGLLLLGVGVFSSMILVQRVQANQAPEEVEIVPMTAVVVVTRDLSLGDRITEADVKRVIIPDEYLPRNIITSTEEVVDKIVKVDLIEGQILLSNNLADPTMNTGDLNLILSDAHVLMAFPADDLLSQEKVIQRGDVVDIFATFQQEVPLPVVENEEGVSEPETETRTFTLDALQNVGITAMVLDVIEEDASTSFMQGDSAQTGNTSNARTRAYLLALDPQDALILKYLKDTGGIFDMVLRVPTSTAQFDLTPVSEQFIIELYGLEILPTP